MHTPVRRSSASSASKRPLRSALEAAVGLALVAFLLAPPSYAEGEGEEGGAAGIEKKVQQQMEKILQLMRENEKAILDASRGGSKQPAGVEVTPPDAAGMDVAVPPPEGGTPPGGTPPPGTTPPPRGDDVRRRMEDLVKQMQGKGGSIPGEIEALLQMIPRSKSGGGGGGQGDPSKRDLPNPDDPSGKKPEDAKDPQKKPEDARGGDKPPPDGEKDKPPKNDEPSWFTELPEQARTAIISGKIEDVPARYRTWFVAYRRWLAEKVKER